MNKLSLTIERRFEAAHKLPNYNGACQRLHGHSWRLWVTASGIVNTTTGMVVDFTRLKELVDVKIIYRLDHQYLGQGELYGLSETGRSHHKAIFEGTFLPTAENLVIRIRDILCVSWEDFMPPNTQLEKVAIAETCTSRATWKRS